MSIRKDDFIRVQKSERVGAIQVEKLPSLHDPDWARALGFDNEEEEENTSSLDEAVKVRPVNLSEYKDHCKKKVKKNWNKKSHPVHEEVELARIVEEEPAHAPSQSSKVPFTGKDGSNTIHNNNTSHGKDDSNAKDNGLTPRQPESTNASSSNPRNKKK